MAAKRKAASMAPEDDDPIDPSDELMFLCLGGGNEVGRSCHIIQYKGKTVMLDAGMHPAHEGLSAMPFYDDFDLSTVDVLLISHFHVDHAASLPYVLAKTNFKGRVFMTHPTKAIYKWLIQDSVRVGNMSSNSETKIQMYTEADHLNTYPMIESIDFYTTHTVAGVRITPYPAGHVLGAAMFLMEIAGLKILFTGDYSREDDRHLVSASVPAGVKVDVLITESTFGISMHTPRVEREAQLMKAITDVLNRGGRALLPVFALGRAQELLLILDEYWSKHPEVQKIPIYYNSSLARKCMQVYQTYVSAMNDNIKRLFAERMAEAEAAGDTGRRGAWDFKFVRSLKSLERFDDLGGCVMLASPGMMQSGTSRELLERWAPDPRNGVIITGYSVEGTMAKQIVHEPDQIPAIMTRASNTARRPGQRENEQTMIPRRCTVQEYSFAAHVDGKENMEFVQEVAAPVVILVHGEKGNMTRLKSKLLSFNAQKAIPTKIYSPANCEELRIPFKTDKIAKVVGKLASIAPPLPRSLTPGGSEIDQKGGKGDESERVDLISGVLIQNDFKISLMAPEDLKEYAGLTTTTILCRQHLTLSAAGIDLIRWALEGTFGAIKESSLTDAAVNGKMNGAENGHKEEEADEEVNRTQTKFTIMDCVSVLVKNGGRVEVEWEGNVINDGIADAVLAVLFTVESSPAAVRQSSKQHSHSHHTDDKNSNDDSINLTHRFKTPHPHHTPDPSTRLARLFLFLEAQFGEEAVRPITLPRNSTTTATANGTPAAAPSPPPSDTKFLSSVAGLPLSNDGDDMPDVDDQLSAQDRAELKRLHHLGIPVPGVEIKFDRFVAKVWLEDLEVECANNALRARVKAVVERGVETVSGLWV
ncbi:Endoribonuclease YSH1 [Pyrenophora tritici-repentis]|uniref:Endoribonuclease YSH1 n=3 Tax=Pyrenophora tritici-repentis TaxID=45151 RepID=A0A922SSD5_9PLEO|nr:endoribonuclease YSH1 [Pyrenophora tritici-repentis Pt-1C-BFP]EDU43222.1 endoribonuclease YSH1 [Pyrenophora tritici-repentis Pt-1C-BFP]KAI1509594.1 Endoribonuclease YSH1 [Pyrenophora tritici-repentis]KAI1670855.1 Endoribonuclease YSH1 [Pyrenophora tritici-repentis]KAI1684591.1 Endoribonuclease YSH1 [Pyrenophora tritici-repentis]